MSWMSGLIDGRGGWEGPGRCIRVRRGLRCPICWSTSWCYLIENEDDEADRCVCMRDEEGSIKEVWHDGGQVGYLHLLRGEDRVDAAALDEFLRACDAERADPELLHRAYEMLLVCLTLEEHHLTDLQRRGMPEQRLGLGYYGSLPPCPERRAKHAAIIVQMVGADAARQVPGLVEREWQGHRYWSIAGRSGLVIPVRDLQGRIVALKVRADSTGDDRYSYLSSAAEGGPSPGAPVHVPAYDGGPVERVRITEGELKADLATELAGVPAGDAPEPMLCLSVPGARNFSKVVEVLETLGVRRVHLAFDQDRAGQAAQVAAYEKLRAAGFECLWESWEASEGKGIDDLLLTLIRRERE